jgi:hypothetical protein
LFYPAVAAQRRAGARSSAVTDFHGTTVEEIRALQRWILCVIGTPPI